MISFLKILVLSIILVPIASAQVNNLVAGGVSYNYNAQPSIAGTFMVAHLTAGTGTYSFAVMDVLPNTTKPFTVTNNIGVGVAQKMFTIGSVNVYSPTTAGISWS